MDGKGGLARAGCTRDRGDHSSGGAFEIGTDAFVQRGKLINSPSEIGYIGRQLIGGDPGIPRFIWNYFSVAGGTRSWPTPAAYTVSQFRVLTTPVREVGRDAEIRTMRRGIGYAFSYECSDEIPWRRFLDPAAQNIVNLGPAKRKSISSIFEKGVYLWPASFIMKFT